MEFAPSCGMIIGCQVQQELVTPLTPEFCDEQDGAHMGQYSSPSAQLSGIRRRSALVEASRFRGLHSGIGLGEASG
ncbi:hypothetical protein OIU77_008738 [Salix suchowensis]|uniref:Uncharacterized protein n=1 Tax=Salix suchowensis TaxID=1278906 RepID=A0ABQ9ABZ6_9ROSI|nr:hypothetical protein OIU77_008738 [Salix suchowensis]